ncbi:MAG: hypothetical protein MUF12_09515 [Sediminibacterium sp.]|nr:hypothetical protein [Sediminibacterium sp.]
MKSVSSSDQQLQFFIQVPQTQQAAIASNSLIVLDLRGVVDSGLFLISVPVKCHCIVYMIYSDACLNSLLLHVPHSVFRLHYEPDMKLQYYWEGWNFTSELK